MVRPQPRRRLAGLGFRIIYNDAPPQVNGDGGGLIWSFPQQPTWGCAPGLIPGQKFGACIPLPGGQTVSVTVAQPPAAAASGGLIPAGTVDRFKAWLQEQSIVSGYENWKVGAFVAGAFLVLKK